MGTLPMDPAGLMWSVVTESPRNRRTRALAIGENSGRLRVMLSKNGGRLMYVDLLLHGYKFPVGASRRCQFGEPVSIIEYT